MCFRLHGNDCKFKILKRLQRKDYEYVLIYLLFMKFPRTLWSQRECIDADTSFKNFIILAMQLLPSSSFPRSHCMIQVEEQLLNFEDFKEKWEIPRLNVNLSKRYSESAQ